MKIFISYEHNVWPLAKAIAEWLKPSGHDVQWDFESLNPGMPFNEKIASLIADSDQIIYLASPASLTSKWVSAELAYARALQKSLMPIKLEGVTNEQIEAMPFIGKVHLLDWPTGRNISTDILKAISNSNYSDLIEINVERQANNVLKIFFKNKAPIDFYDVKTDICVEFEGKLEIEFSPVIEERFLVLPRGEICWVRREVKEFTKNIRLEGDFYSDRNNMIVLCKYCFQNQERYFYVSKRFKLNLLAPEKTSSEEIEKGN